MSKKKKKSGPIMPKPASVEALALSKWLLDIADTDLRAALVLHGAAAFPQAIFFLQQAVEKICKACGLSAGIAKPSDLTRDWSHNTLRHAEIFSEYHEQQRQAQGKPQVGMPPEKIKEFTDQMKDPKKMHAGAMLGFLTWGLGVVADYETRKSNPAVIQNEKAASRKWAVGEGTDPVQVARAEAIGDRLAEIAEEGALILHTTMMLGIVVLPHAVRCRYPEDGTSPLALYQANFPIVTALPQLCAISRALLGSVRAHSEATDDLMALLGPSGIALPLTP